MVNFKGDTGHKAYGSGMRSVFDASTKNITQKDFNQNRQVKNLLAVKEKVLASNFIENNDPQICSNSYIPSLVNIPDELRHPSTSSHILSPGYKGDHGLKVSKFQTWQDKIGEYWDKPVVKLTISFLIGLTGIMAASALIKRAMAQKIGSKAKNFNEIKSLLDKQISENLDDVALNLKNIADKLIKTANQDMAGDTKKYQQLIDFSQQFKTAATQTKTGKMPDKIELLFANLKGHLNKYFTPDELSKLSPGLKQIAEQFKNSQQLPAFARNININSDINATILNAIQDPTNVKNVQAVFAVLGATAIAATGKRFTDGISEIWVKQKEATIQRDLQEAMIAIETRAFSGKNDLLRNMLADHATSLKDMANNNWKRNFSILKDFMDKQQNNPAISQTAIAFKGKNNDIFKTFNNFNNDETFKGDLTKQDRIKADSNNKKIMYTLLGVGGLLTVCTLYLVMRNLAKTVKVADALKQDVLKRTNFLSDDVIEILKKDTPFSVQDAVFGNPTKIGIASYVEGVTGFLYTYIMNKTPETLLAFLAIVGTTGGGYIGSRMLDAIKEVEVKRVNAETERRLQERLVEVELKNFMAKKNSLVRPLVKEYEHMIETNASNNQLNAQYNLILDELRNGPPFVYA